MRLFGHRNIKRKYDELSIICTTSEICMLFIYDMATFVLSPHFVNLLRMFFV